MTEVRRYARLAATLALREDFDVIHAHDWMTYPAGMYSQGPYGQASGGPHPRYGMRPRRKHWQNRVAGLERAGMLAADVVVAVSRLTRKTVVERHSIALNRGGAQCCGPARGGKALRHPAAHPA